MSSQGFDRNNERNRLTRAARIRRVNEARAKAKLEEQRKLFKGPSTKAKGLIPQLSWNKEEEEGKQTMRDVRYLTTGKELTPQEAKLYSREARGKLTSKEKGKIIHSEKRRKRRDSEKRAMAAVEEAYKKEAIEKIQAKVRHDEDEKEKKIREIEKLAKSLDVGIGKNSGKNSGKIRLPKGLPKGLDVWEGGKTRRRKRKRRRKTKKKKKRRRRTKKKKNKRRRRKKTRRRK